MATVSSERTYQTDPKIPIELYRPSRYYRCGLPPHEQDCQALHEMVAHHRAPQIVPKPGYDCDVLGGTASPAKL
ncbi:MAG: hypothetical protein OEY77_01180 [Nitrospira sp.]|nr:hypothetical protein [Nitrospira sp.]